MAAVQALFFALLSASPAGPTPDQTSSLPEQHDAFAYVRALDDAGARNLWPGFDPSAWPVALFDGERTILLRHPSPPTEFTPMPDRPGVLVSPGRYSAVVGNSTREIGGVRTATVIATPGRSVESTMLATVEEVFHVFWLARHPSFRPDEMARYAYPVNDVDNLYRLLAEDEALARALEADIEQEAAEWAATALQMRRERAPNLSDAVRIFETALEMMEGTANYTARRACGQEPGQTGALLRAPRPADGIRWRFYDTGTALCFLLDRFDPGWKVRSEKEPELTTVELLTESLAPRGVATRSFSEADVARFRTQASRDIADLAGRIQELRQDLLTRPGARAIIETADAGTPFRAQRFDPINLFVLDRGEVVQANYITLASPSGTVELANPGFARKSLAGTVALTVPAGSHPLTDGIRQVTIVGIDGTPQVSRDEGTITVVGRGVRIELRGADLRTEGETIRITVPIQPPSR